MTTRGTKRERLNAHQLLDLVVDEGSWASWDSTPERGEVSPEYAAELARAAEKSYQELGSQARRERAAVADWLAKKPVL